MAYNLDRILGNMVERGASSAHLKCRTPVYFRLLERLERTTHPVPDVADIDGICSQVLENWELERYKHRQQVDKIHIWGNPGRRFRFSFFRQRGTPGLVVRSIPSRVPTLKEIGLPPITQEMLSKRRGILLVTGPASSGKTTTVAAILSAWNEELEHHIVTLENPIEYVLDSKKCVVTQRQVGNDTETFSTGLKHVLRQDPDVIFIGELDSLETLTIAIAAAETGHLVISTLHTPSASTTIEQIIGMYPPALQEQVRLQLSMSLVGIISQVLIPSRDRTRRVAAFEVMTPSESLRNLVRLNQSFRIPDALTITPGCVSLAKSMAELVDLGQVSQNDARRFMTDRLPSAVQSGAIQRPT
jgi:twitching motility protein PilT